MSGHTDFRGKGVARTWDSLDQLREVALSRGCTLAQFAYAVEAMGPEPRHVANYLQRHQFADCLSKAELRTDVASTN